MIRALEAERALDHHELRFRRMDDSLVWVDISLRLLDFNDEPAILSALHDITERKAAEARLQQQVEALRLELEQTSKDTALARSTGTTRFENLDAAVLQRGATELIAVHSFRGGNGKSSLTANLAALLAAAGQRVGVIDADLQSPGLHLLLGQAGKTARPHAQRLPAGQLRRRPAGDRRHRPSRPARGRPPVPDPGQPQPGHDGAGAEPGLRRATADAQLPRAGRDAGASTPCSSTPIPA